jgi:hypothetical protein
MKKLFPFVAVGLAVFILSFNPRPIPHSLLHRKKVTNAVDPLNPTLYPLFIENSDKNKQLDLLIQLGTRSWIAGDFRKMIFQFVYQNKNDGFTLVAYGGRRKQKGIDSTKFVLFKSYITPCVTVPPNYKVYNIGPNVYLGDLEFYKQKEVMDTLKKYSSQKADYPYIVFYPWLEDPVIVNGITRIHVRYLLYAVSDLSEICKIGAGNPVKKNGVFTVTQGNASTNPSPPRNGN